MLAFKSYNIHRIKILVDISKLPAPNCTSTPFLDVFAESSHVASPYLTHQTHEEAFWHTIIADTHTLHWPASHDYWRHWASVFTRSATLRKIYQNTLLP
jgi:hypothetical protein